MNGETLLNLSLPEEIDELVQSSPHYWVPRNIGELINLACRDSGTGWQEVAYDIPGRGRVVEAKVSRVRNGVVVNYVEPYMRRRDPNCMVIADRLPTNKPHFRDLFRAEFDDLRRSTLEWLKSQEIILVPFVAGVSGTGLNAIAIVPANAGFFALSIALLQGLVDLENLRETFTPNAALYVAPPFRHTHFGGKQIVVHNRQRERYEIFSYNLYPGPSAKKGVFGMLIHVGEQEQWITAHCSTVQVVTPYGNKVTVMHEGASGGGKSEMLEHIHRERDGSLLLGRNIITEERRSLVLPRACDLHPVTDDIALCHPSLQKGDGRLSLRDAEDGWFVRVNHITRYGTDPHLEEITISPPEPLLFLNIDAVPGSTALIWEHIDDAPGRKCPNPRVVLPRRIVPGVIQDSVTVDIRSFGVRTPPCTKQVPTYGILGLFHLLPPSLAWLWRLVAPRGHENPSIVDTERMSSEGVGSYWPFATGRRIDQANLLLKQIMETPETRYILCPNQHIGAWVVGFMPQWIAREFLARRGGAKFKQEEVVPARSPLLGYALKTVVVEGQTIGSWFLRVEQQPEVGEEAYDQGAEILTDFFHQHLAQYLESDLIPEGRRIIECCLSGGSLEDYNRLIDSNSIIDND